MEQCAGYDLSILYGKSGLKDMNQLITYQYEADSTNRQWYSVLRNIIFFEKI